MSLQDDNKAIVGRWFTEFWGERCNLAVVDEIQAPACLEVRSGGVRLLPDGSLTLALCPPLVPCACGTCVLLPRRPE